ncbi:MAG: DUF5615 family PIN-like protein [Pseudonocardiaceae bacterium]
MKIKLDENAVVAAKDLFFSLGHEADSVPDEEMTGAPDPTLLDACRREERVLATFDLGFGDARVYPPDTYPGIVLLRLADQQPDAVPHVLRRLLADHDLDWLAGCLIIVTDQQARIPTQIGLY